MPLEDREALLTTLRLETLEAMVAEIGARLAALEGQLFAMLTERNVGTPSATSNTPARGNTALRILDMRAKLVDSRLPAAVSEGPATLARDAKPPKKHKAMSGKLRKA